MYELTYITYNQVNFKESIFRKTKESADNTAEFLENLGHVKIVKVSEVDPKMISVLCEER